MDACAPPAMLALPLVPSEFEVLPTGDEPPGHVILFADDGRLSYRQCVYFDRPPTR